MRLDLYLVQNKYCESRSKAAELIKSGSVQVSNVDGFKIVTSPSLKVNDNTKINILDKDLLKYVARSGLKLEAAIKELNISVKDFCVLDIGQSTGGFSDCLLQHGARKVVGVDVGHRQLSEKIKQDSRVEYYEGINAKELLKSTKKEGLSFAEAYSNFFDFCCIDVSFISLNYIINQVVPLLKKGGYLLALVKPQFEVGQKFLKNGVVNQPRVYETLQIEIETLIKNEKLNKLDYVSSQLTGKKGNKEFFIYAQK